MSQMTATARSGLRAPAGHPEERTTRLQVVSGREARSGGAGFVLLCTGLLVATMLALLVLNTARAEASFKVSDLKATSGRLADTENVLRTHLALEESPAHLATRARSQGMVPAPTAAFLRTTDGKVLGVAEKAKASTDFRVVQEAAPSPVSPGASAAASHGAETASVGGAVEAAAAKRAKNAKDTKQSAKETKKAKKPASGNSTNSTSTKAKQGVKSTDQSTTTKR